MCHAVRFSISGSNGMTENQNARITARPDRCGERPCIRDTRVRVRDITDMLADGVDRADIPESFSVYRGVMILE